MSIDENHDLIEWKLFILTLQIKTDMKREMENVQLHIEEVETQLLEKSIRRILLKISQIIPRY